MFSSIVYWFRLLTTVNSWINWVIVACCFDAGSQSWIRRPKTSTAIMAHHGNTALWVPKNVRSIDNKAIRLSQFLTEQRVLFGPRTNSSTASATTDRLHKNHPHPPDLSQFGLKVSLAKLPQFLVEPPAVPPETIAPPGTRLKLSESN